MTTLTLLRRLLSLTFVLLNLKLLAAFNLALNKIAMDCRGNRLSNKLVDGNILYENVEIVTTECVSEVFVKIDLQGKFIVNYVIVYEGRGATPGQLDFFKVKLANVRHEIFTFESTQHSFGSRGGMRVNVDMTFSFVIYVQIQPRTGLNIHLSEVEVHSMVPTASNVRPLVYRGCFYDFVAIQSKVINGSIFERCKLECLLLQTYFLAIKENQCLCGNFLNRFQETTFRTCDVCPDGNGYCGSPRGYSVYIARFQLPIYFGCFSKSILRQEDIALFIDNLTLQLCNNHCENHGFTSISNGHTCICNNIINGTRYDQSECLTSCQGDERQLCGSDNHFTAYKSCQLCYVSYMCRQRPDGFGSCESHGCENTMYGENCFSRINISTPILTPIVPITQEVSTTRRRTVRPITQVSRSTVSTSTVPNECQISNPCINQPLTYCIVFRGVTLCDCLVGYSRNILTNECNDINECDYEPCDNKSSTCKNLNGSYDCECLSGLFKIGDSSCVANDSDGSDVIIHEPSYTIFLFVFPAICLLLLLATFVCLFKEKFGASASSSPRNISRFDKRSTD